jgi:hypothetical protein
MEPRDQNERNGDIKVANKCFENVSKVNLLFGKYSSKSNKLENSVLATVKNYVFWGVTLHSLVEFADVSEDHIASILFRNPLLSKNQH